ncbi:proline-rich proteoglycan 2-like [Trematomus bernacchii]|uniref:proline-rich proteoglycan 2-like n=1 Tax=Trematomus bernacchii TaxID=40690 RepID=UPI00146BECEF|nr:proline-rich proteoglycan 2-like [Trematomus bernacchii]XP_033980094.1 proline-rich proteoglycan 2-like [Trematomus bernacchii]
MEEEIITTEAAGEDVAPNDEEPSVDISNDSPSKRGRGRPKKLKVVVTDVNLMVSDISNGEPPQTPRGRGRPKLIKPTEQQGSGDNNADDSGSQKEASDEDDASPEHSPKKRGRPRKSLSTPAKADTPKGNRGRPKGSTKRKSESPSETGSPNRSRKVEAASNGISKKLRESPRKSIEQESGDEKRGRGRPKGSPNKKPPAYKVPVKVGRAKKGRIGRPRKEPTTRGRPRKYPRPTPEELNKPRVWKPLGRPRKYPRPDPPEETSPAPPRNRGRPRKTESNKGAHLRKNFPASSSPPKPYVGPPRKRGRPPKSDAETPRKLGRPKGSINKNKATSDLEATLSNEANEEQTVEEEVQQSAETSIEDITE